MAQRFLAPEVTFEGLVKQKGTVSHDEHLITRGYLHGNVINAIHPDSANYASVVADGGVNKLKIDPLTITSVTVNSTQSSLANFVSNVYTGSNFQEGDIVFLTATSPTEAYIHNGGTANSANDWELVNSGLSDAQIRAKFSASAGIDYDASTGAFTADQGEIKAFFSAGTGLSYSDGQFSLNATSDQITEGSNNKFFTTARVDAHLSGGTGISYNAGEIAFNGNTGNVAEGSNLYFTDARARGALSLASVSSPDVQLLTYNSGTGALSLPASSVFAQFDAGTGLSYADGVYTLNANTSQITENASALYFTDARARAAISVDAAGLNYNSGTGVIALTADSDDISEGSSNLYFTNARAQAAISADSAAGNLATVSGGQVLVALSSIRKGFANQSLTANTSLNLTHNLGERLVHVSAMDSSGNKVDLEIVYTSTSVVTVKSTIGLTGIDIAVSV
tara:strand:+ start:233 stop:1588 length:1356 start_codon:yes stop_codon:yes gene_type:complete